jgi:hypothetical protein
VKAQFKSSIVPSSRCYHCTAAGRQCRQLSADSQSQLCAHHLDQLKQKEVNDLSRTLLARSQNFRTAQGVNFALANIYRLLAANRISPRRASVLAYINSLLLRTLPAIDYDHATGHKDPTAPKEDEDDQDESETEDEIESDSSTMDAEDPSENAAPPNSFSKATQGWTASIPEPDPTKKPS